MPSKKPSKISRKPITPASFLSSRERIDKILILIEEIKDLMPQGWGTPKGNYSLTCSIEKIEQAEELLKSITDLKGRN